MLGRKTLIAFALLSFSVATNAQKFSNTDLPIILPFQYTEPLDDVHDLAFQQKLVQRLTENKKWKTLISQKKLAVGVVDLNDPLNVKYAAINGNEMMYAASLPKIAVLLAATDALEKGELKETREVLQDMRLMISKSDNHASTRMIDRLGYKKIEKVLTDPRYEFYDRDNGGGLWVGKRYAATGGKNPDPLKGLSHAATVNQVCRFYYMLAFGKLVSFERSRQMLDFMVDPQLHHKFVNTLDRVAPTAKLYRKSGSWQNFHSDSILVWGDEWHKYILVALAEDEEGERIMRELVSAVEEVIKSQNLQLATK